MSRTRRAHRLLGLVLLLPLCGWASTAFVFFLKPGYGAAYGPLRIREYPLADWPEVRPEPGWLETRVMRTTVGTHLLVRTKDGWTQREPETLRVRPLPDEAGVRRLVSDAIRSDTARYGEIATVSLHPAEPPGASIETTTGTRIDLDWSGLTLQQSGRDTRLIDGLYRIHYLQWTGIRSVDRILGVGGLLCVFLLAGLGLRLAFGGVGSPSP